MAVIETEIVFDPILGPQAVKRLIDKSEDAGELSGKKFTQGFRRNSIGIAKGLNKSLGNLSKRAVQFGGLFAAAIAGITFSKAVNESKKVETALRGLDKVSASTGLSIDKARAAALNFSKDGTIPLGDSVRTLRNLIVNFDGDLDKSVSTFKSFRDAASVVRQESLSLGEAIASSSEGLRQDLSIKLDNGGITKNLSDIYKDYAATIDVGANSLTKAQKAQAEFVGIQQEGARFTGAYTESLNTFDGVMSKVTGGFSFLLNELGKFITQSPAVIAVIDKFGESLFKTKDAIADLNKGDGAKRVITNIINIGRAAIKTIEPIAIFGRSVSIVFQSINTGVAAILAGFGKLGQGAAGLLEFFGQGGELSEGLKNFGEVTGDVLLENANSLSESINGLFDPVALAESADSWLVELQAAVDSAKEITGDLKLKGSKDFEDLANTAKANAKAINAAVRSSLVSGLSNSIAKLGQNIGEGKSLFADFGKFILGVLGDIAIQIGTTAIAAGITLKALTSLKGGAAIAAGIALVAIGGILKGLSGGQGGIGGNGSAVGATAVGSTVETPDTEPEVREEAGTSVNVVVQGDVFDSDQTQQRLFSLINDGNEKQGLTFTGDLSGA